MAKLEIELNDKDLEKFIKRGYSRVEKEAFAKGYELGHAQGFDDGMIFQALKDYVNEKKDSTVLLQRSVANCGNKILGGEE